MPLIIILILLLLIFGGAEVITWARTWVLRRRRSKPRPRDHHYLSARRQRAQQNIAVFEDRNSHSNLLFSSDPNPRFVPSPGRPASNVSVLLVPESVREWFRCRILRPLLRQLRGGVTPRRLAWSLALGVVIGINPSVGLTTLVVVMLAWAFGLNQIASQIGSHVVAPIHLLLFLPFIQLGVYLFHTRRLPSAGSKSSISAIIPSACFTPSGSGSGMHW